MKVKCNWCGSWIQDSDTVCPRCNGINENYRQGSSDVPRTIEELKSWAEKHNLPLSDMRTYIGENYAGPKAFGIYKDSRSGNFIVYKNKSDGSRAIRYDGPNEEAAVNELYLKMRERVAEQKAYSAGRTQQKPNSYTSSSSKKRRRKFDRGTRLVLYATLLVWIVITSLVNSVITPSRGYYNYEGNTYYFQNNDWYVYDSYHWTRCYDDLSDLFNHHSDYRVSDYTDYDVTDFKDSVYYESSFKSDSWDSDYDWDSGSDWDDGFDDWDSDW